MRLESQSVQAASAQARAAGRTLGGDGTRGVATTATRAPRVAGFEPRRVTTHPQLQQVGNRCAHGGKLRGGGTERARPHVRQQGDPAGAIPRSCSR